MTLEIIEPSRKRQDLAWSESKWNILQYFGTFCTLFHYPAIPGDLLSIPIVVIL